MTKKSVIIIAILVVLLVILGVVVWLCGKNDANVYVESTDYPSQVIEVDPGTGTLETLLGELD